MISALRGTIREVIDASIILEVSGGVGYLVYVHRGFLDSLTLEQISGKAEVFIYTDMAVKDEKIYLYGFSNMLEKQWYEFLTKVSGVGGKTALSIIGFLGLERIINAIMMQEEGIFVSVPQIGGKIAKRIVTELKNVAQKYGTLHLSSLSEDIIGSRVEERSTEKGQLTSRETASSTNKAALKQSNEVSTKSDNGPKKVSSKKLADSALDATQKQKSTIFSDAVSALVSLGLQRGNAFDIVQKTYSQNKDATLEELITLCLQGVYSGN